MRRSTIGTTSGAITRAISGGTIAGAGLGAIIGKTIDEGDIVCH